MNSTRSFSSGDLTLADPCKIYKRVFDKEPFQLKLFFKWQKVFKPTLMLFIKYI